MPSTPERSPLPSTGVNNFEQKIASELAQQKQRTRIASSKKLKIGTPLKIIQKNNSPKRLSSVTPPRLSPEERFGVAESLAQERQKHLPEISPVNPIVEELDKKPAEENPSLTVDKSTQKNLFLTEPFSNPESSTSSKKSLAREKINNTSAPIMRLINRGKIKNLQKHIRAQQNQIRTINKELEPEIKELNQLKRKKKWALLEDFWHAVLASFAKGGVAVASILGMFLSLYYSIIKPIYLAIKYLILGKSGKKTAQLEKNIQAKQEEISKIEERKKPLEQAIRYDIVQIRYLSQLMREPASDNSTPESPPLAA